MDYSQLTNDADKQNFVNNLYDEWRNDALKTTERQRFVMMLGEVSLDVIVDFINYCDYKTFCNTIDILLEYNYITLICECAMNIYEPTGINIFEKTKYIINKIPKQHKTQLYEYISINYIENANDISNINIAIIYYIFMKGDIDQNYLNILFKECYQYRDYNNIKIFNMLRFRKQFIMFI